jgi:hypothetical protein
MKDISRGLSGREFGKTKVEKSKDRDVGLYWVQLGCCRGIKLANILMIFYISTCTSIIHGWNILPMCCPQARTTPRICARGRNLLHVPLFVRSGIRG